MHNGLEGILHVLGLCNFLVGPFIVEAQYRDTKLIHLRRIDLTIIVFPCQSGTTTCHPYVCTIETTVIIFQSSSIATHILFSPICSGNHTIYVWHPVHKAIGWHVQATTVFNMVTSREIQRLVVLPPRRIDMYTSCTILIISFSIQ